MSKPQPTTAQLEALAIKPFQLLEQLGLPSGYERSFKLSRGTISANRYLLGVDLTLVSDSTLSTICDHLGMPRLLFKELMLSKQAANLVLLGFDLNGTQPIYKVYLEFWEQIQAHKGSIANSNQAQLMHKGFKWACLEPNKTNITEYHYQPGLDQGNIRQQVSGVFQQQDSYCHNSAQNIIDLAYSNASQHTTNGDFIYLKVSEGNNLRNSFDINLYPAKLNVASIESEIVQLASQLEIEQVQVSRLMSLVRDKALGHISSGIGRSGQQYLTVYYEQ